VYSFTPTVSNPSGSALTFSIQGTPHWATFNSKSGQLNGAPSSTDVGTASNIVISVTNGTTPAVLPAFSITVVAAAAAATYTVTYNANGATGGTAPTDTKSYAAGATVTVLGNTGNLARTGYTFSNWNTTANGSGTAYGAGSTLAMGSANVALYAQWTANAPPSPPPPSNDPTTGVLPSYNDAFANWKNAGLSEVGGTAAIDAARTTTCASVSPTGKIPPQSGDDSSTINAAINLCPTNQVLMLGTASCTCAAPCVFNFDQSEYVALNKSITIRGYGNACSRVTSAGSWWPVVLNVYNGAIADWVISIIKNGANCGVTSASVSTCKQATGVVLMSPSSNWNWGWAGCNLGSTPTNCGTTLAADAAQGQATIQVANTAKFSVGMWVLIDENPQVVSTANPTGGANVQASSDWLSSSGAPATMRLAGGDEPTVYSFNPNRVNAELHLVTAVGMGPCPGTNCTLTFDDPLTLAFRESGGHNAQVYWPTLSSSATANPFLQTAGLENLTITRPADGGVQIEFCAYCFVKHVEVSTWMQGAVNVQYAARAQIESNYFHTGADLENNGGEYPIGISSAATEAYVVDNIIVLGGKGMVGRAANSAVVAYNYADDTMYQNASIGDYWVDMDLNGSHYAGTHHFLFEGNWGDNCDGDETHGNSIYHTFFRNDCTGLRTPFVDPSNGFTVDDSSGIGFSTGGVAISTTAPLRAAGPMAFDYWYAFVGNVLGTPGQTIPGKGWAYQCASPGRPSNKCIWMSGWVGSEWPAPDPHLTTTTNPYIFRHGDYDYVNAAVFDWTTNYSKTLPNSFYLSSAPSFFSSGAICSYPWPWVTPTGSTPVQTNSCGGSGLPAKARYEAGTPFTQP
jgi:hypothetical protein